MKPANREEHQQHQDGTAKRFRLRLGESPVTDDDAEPERSQQGGSAQERLRGEQAVGSAEGRRNDIRAEEVRDERRTRDRSAGGRRKIKENRRRAADPRTPVQEAGSGTGGKRYARTRNPPQAEPLP